jgi:uncharacterized RDD family membrane protein YckC
MRSSAPPLDPEARARAEAARAKRLQDEAAAAAAAANAGVNPYAAPARIDEPFASGSSDLFVVDAPEAPLAGRGARLLAQLLDGVLGLICGAPGFLLVVAGVSQGGPANAGLARLGLMLILVAIVGLIIYQIRLLAREGQTWGKKMMKVRIVLYETGEIPHLGRTLGLRIFVNSLIGMVPCLGSIYSLADPLFIFGNERRCLHDLIAGTKVVEAG